jgi:hypothetical protein
MMRFSISREIPTTKTNILAVKRPEAVIPFALFVVGALIGMLQLADPIPFGDGFEMVAIAKNLASHGTFANPCGVLNTGFTAANPPLYPLFLAAFIKIFRLPALVMTMASVGSIVMNAITASLLPRVSLLFFGDMMPGIAASILWLGSVRLMPAWDTSYTAAGLLAFCLCSSSLIPKSRESMINSVLAGLLAGLLFLLNPSVLMILIPWIAYLGLRRKLPFKESAILFVIFMFIAFGWMARNYRELGAFVVRTNLGFTLYASNNDCAQPSLLAEESTNCYQSHHPNTSFSEAQALRSVGEVQFDHQRIADVKAWIKTHPSKFRTLTLERIRDFWFPPLQKQQFIIYGIWAASALSIPGLILMIYRREPVTLFIMMVLLLYPLMYYIVVSGVRYRYPVLWLSLLPAGYFVHQLLFQQLRFNSFSSSLNKAIHNIGSTASRAVNVD